MSYGPRQFALEYGVSRETSDRLAAFDSLLLEWSARQNLIARSTIESRWERHFRDSAQLYPLLPAAARTVADFGSGAGFPGLVLAAMGADSALTVALVESVSKKAAFLRAAVEAMGLTNARVLHERAEKVELPRQDVITARAVAPLSELLSYAGRVAQEDTVLFFPKGQDIEGELTHAAKYWHMVVERRPSVTRSDSTILVIRRLRRKRQS